VKDPIVIDPADFDQKAAWNECADYVDKCGGLSHDDGSPNWRAAFAADPGVVSCPMCKEFYWMWGRKQRCSECGFEYPTDWWPMFSWGASASRQDPSKRYRFDERMKHPYFAYGFNNPPSGDAYEAAFKINWREVLGATQ